MENEANNKNKKYDESRVYYVYKHVRLDNNTCFYIGKGKNGRKDDPKRNAVHDSIYNKHGCKVVIFKDKLTEEEAYKLEEDLINCYVHKIGYGICIKGYMNNNNKFLTNMNWGGIGVFSGMHHSEEEIKKMSESLKGRQLSEETKQKMSESHKGKSHKGKSGKKLICITTGKIFNTQKEAENYYNVGNISKCCRGIRKSAGKLSDGTKLQWKYLEDYNNEFKGNIN